MGNQPPVAVSIDKSLITPGIYTLHRDNLNNIEGQPATSGGVCREEVAGIYTLHTDNSTERGNQPPVAVSTEKRWQTFTLYTEII